MEAPMRKQFISVLFLAFLFSSFSIYGQSLQNRERDIGITAAYWLEGDVTVEGFDATKDAAFLLRTFADFYLMPKLAMGLFFNFSPYTIGNDDVTIYEFGGSIKPRFMLDKDLALKPGLNIGYRFTSADYAIYEIDALGLNLSIELQKQLKNMILHGEFGFLSQPAGGNSDVEVVFAPIIYFGAGITF
jgi:hypothetical protein